MRNDLVSVGFISRAHGTAGEIVIQPTNDALEIFSVDQVITLRNGREELPARAETLKLVRKGNQHSFFVKFEHITNRTEAERLKGFEVFLPESLIPESDEQSDEDLIGYKILSEDGTLFGEVIDVVENPAHTLLQVKDADGAYYVPFVDAYILGIDDENAEIVATGLSELKAISE